MSDDLQILVNLDSASHLFYNLMHHLRWKKFVMRDVHFSILQFVKGAPPSRCH